MDILGVPNLVYNLQSRYLVTISNKPNYEDFSFYRSFLCYQEKTSMKKKVKKQPLFTIREAILTFFVVHKKGPGQCADSNRGDGRQGQGPLVQCPHQCPVVGQGE